MSLKIACAQLNQRVGDMAGNAERIIAAAARAAGEGAQVLLTPELSLCGYLPGDNLFRPAFQQQVDAAVETIRQASAQQPGLHWVVGYPVLREGRRHSAAGVFHQGRQVAEYLKAELPDYGVFDETRYFQPQADATVFTVAGVRCALLICEDTWLPAAPARARTAGAELVLSLNASPFQSAKGDLRADTLRSNVCAQGMAVVACNLVGGQDELVFDGQSLALDAQGRLAARAPSFVEDLLLVTVERGADGALALAGSMAPALERLPEIYQALVLGIRDYIGKNGFGGVVLGLSGGIDSALTLALAVDALGAERVRTVMMPSPYTADISLADAKDMAARLGVKHEVLPIAPCFDAFRGTLANTFAGLPEDLTEENIQARIRGTLLMAISNKTGWLVLTTGNKSELAVGYSTLYGDMAGGFAPLKDVLKTVVYQLSNWRNAQSPVIPERIITRPPSAELRPDQTDQDSLPPYDVLDRIIQGYMEQDRPAASLVAEGLPADAVAQVVRLLRLAEYKRQQGPVGPRVTARAFGRDWRYPITSAFREPVGGQGA
ncbi:NAD+ synthase [Lautropia mirabilis]|uniref:NAD+ synthase n=1 Tax=Lautropia mirabilis TaxID=47671 RepID=UPI0028ED9BAB|nr:NAD+ synthase [Lautropia mirabilis]